MFIEISKVVVIDFEKGSGGSRVRCSVWSLGRKEFYIVWYRRKERKWLVIGRMCGFEKVVE